MSGLFHPEVELRTECVRIALNMHSTGQREFTARDVVASARVIERYVSGTKRGKDSAAQASPSAYPGNMTTATAGGANSVKPSLNPVERSA